MTDGGIWAGLDRLIDAADSLDGLEAHRVHLLAARRWRATGRPVPRDLALKEIVTLQREAAARKLLARARDAFDGKLILLKGLEVGAYYPAPGLRPVGDVDLLADEPERAQAALIDAGFVRVGTHDDIYYDGLHHLRPLTLDGGTVAVEIHRRPNWVEWVDPPPRSALAGMAVEGAAGVDGVAALPREHHAVVVAAHSWGERPLRRMLDLVDVAVLADGVPRDRIVDVAAQWGLERLWSTTRTAIDALLLGRGEPLTLRVWARDLRELRECSVLDAHLRSWLGPFLVQPPSQALAATARQLVRDATPTPGETWMNKLHRVRHAVANPGRSLGEHAGVIGPAGLRPRHRRRPD